MFRKPQSPQLYLFESPSNLMGKRASKKYDDPKAWHNQFYELVTTKVNEDNFAPLYKGSGKGVPTASIRILASMNVLKEGFGCSDEELFEKCKYDLLVRKALGMVNLSDKTQTPSLDTYYCLRRRLVDYEERTGINLMDTCFKNITKEQLKQFHIAGKSVRMDSKLIGSNIAWYSRYRLILTTLQQWGKNGVSLLNPSLQKQVEPYLTEDGQKTEYHSDAESIHQRLILLGALIYKILVRIKADDSLLLKRVFNEQYLVEKGVVTPREKRTISAQSVQNPNDPDADYRGKGNQKVKGYSVNVTETNDDNDDQEEDRKPSLITDVTVKPASAADNGYLQDSIEATKELTGNEVSRINADGAYQSQGNREYAQEHNIQFVTTGLQGKRSRFDVSLSGDELTAVDCKTGDALPVKRVKDKWRVTFAGKHYYLTREQVDKRLLRKQLESLPQELLNKRNNVEAAMFQVSFHTRNNKTRYRGLLKHAIWADARCLWMNFVRLMNYQITTGQRTFSAFISAFEELFTDLYLRMVGLERTSKYFVVAMEFDNPGPIWTPCHKD